MKRRHFLLWFTRTGLMAAIGSSGLVRLARAKASTVQIRRVVTGHNKHGRAVVTIDGLCRDVSEDRSGVGSAVIWATDRVPADNMDPIDPAALVSDTDLPRGTVFRVLEYAPGAAPRRHRTASIDYAVVLSGEIWMQLDDTEVHLRAGDVLVQRGTIHNWVNRGTEPCRIAFVLIGAEPIVV